MTHHILQLPPERARHNELSAGGPRQFGSCGWIDHRPQPAQPANSRRAGEAARASRLLRFTDAATASRGVAILLSGWRDDVQAYWAWESSRPAARRPRPRQRGPRHQRRLRCDQRRAASGSLRTPPLCTSTRAGSTIRICRPTLYRFSGKTRSPVFAGKGRTGIPSRCPSTNSGAPASCSSKMARLADTSCGPHPRSRSRSRTDLRWHHGARRRW